MHRVLATGKDNLGADACTNQENTVFTETASSSGCGVPHSRTDVVNVYDDAAIDGLASALNRSVTRSPRPAVLAASKHNHISSRGRCEIFSRHTETGSATPLTVRGREHVCEQQGDDPKRCLIVVSWR